jgi:hypothetical protein
MAKPKRWRPTVGDTLYVLEWRPPEGGLYHDPHVLTFSPAKVVRVGTKKVDIELRGYFQTHYISSINQHFTAPNRYSTGHLFTEKWASFEALDRWKQAAERLQ